MRKKFKNQELIDKVEELLQPRNIHSKFQWYLIRDALSELDLKKITIS